MIDFVFLMLGCFDVIKTVCKFYVSRRLVCFRKNPGARALNFLFIFFERKFVMRNFLKNKLVLGGVALLSAGVANAAIDTTSITTAMTDASAAIALVGAAYVVVKVGTKVYKWVAAAM
jgi:hypothetical protein